MLRLIFIFMLALTSAQLSIADELDAAQRDSLTVSMGVRVGGGGSDGFRPILNSDDAGKSTSLVGFDLTVLHANGFQIGIGFERSIGDPYQITGDTINYLFQISQFESRFVYISPGYLGMISKAPRVRLGASIDLGLLWTHEDLSGLLCCSFDIEKERLFALRPKIVAAYDLVHFGGLQFELGWMFADSRKLRYEYPSENGYRGYKAEYSGPFAAAMISLAGKFCL